MGDPMRLLSVVGARPQFIKAAVVSRALAERGIEEVLVHTGQHYDADMSDVFFDELELPRPAHHLGIGGGSHGRMTGRMLEAIEAVLVDEAPDWCLVYGDTNSTLAGALAAVKLHVPIAHVEAGLRSHNRRMPEEINRVLTDHAADLLFAPTDTAANCLAAEGLSARCCQVGDVMYDAALYYGGIASQRDTLARFGLQRGQFVLATVHRAENTNSKSRLKIIVDALLEVARDLDVVLPLHPRTRAGLEAVGLLRSLEDAIQLIPPVGYLDILELQRNAALVATDSGGVQKEAFFCGVPCVTLREETEWEELIELGWNVLAPPEEAAVVAETIKSQIGTSGQLAHPYGEGNAANIIAQVLAEPLNRQGS